MTPDSLIARLEKIGGRVDTREMAYHFNVSEAEMFEALAELEERGAVERRTMWAVSKT